MSADWSPRSRARRNGGDPLAVVLPQFSTTLSTNTMGHSPGGLPSTFHPTPSHTPPPTVQHPGPVNSAPEFSSATGNTNVPACTASPWTSNLDVGTWTHPYTYKACKEGTKTVEALWTTQSCSLHTDFYTKYSGAASGVKSSFIFCATPTNTSITTRSFSLSSILAITPTSTAEISSITVPSHDNDPPSTGALVIVLPVVLGFLTVSAIIAFVFFHRRNKSRSPAVSSSDSSIIPSMPYSPGSGATDGNHTTVTTGARRVEIGIGRKWTGGGHRDYGNGVPRPPPKVRQDRKRVGYDCPPSSPYGPI